MTHRTKSPEETKEIARSLAARLKGGGTVLLYGDLGAGKTTFVKGMATAFGLKEGDVTSASFTIIAAYDTTPPFFHIDLYRLSSAEDIEMVGLYEYLEADGVAAIEWPEKIPAADLPANSVKVQIRLVTDTEREIIISDAEN